MALLPVEDALSRVLGNVVPLDAEVVSVWAALGRVLAEDLRARLTQPPFAASAMDGYAVSGACATRGSELAVVGAAQAGLGFTGEVKRGEAVRIFTGAPLPPGTDTVVIQENSERRGDTVLLTSTTPPGANVRSAGIDFREGEVLLPAGHKVTAHSATLIAAAGHGEIKVRRRPVVAILATGDELVAPGSTPGPDQIVSSNPVGIAGLVAEAGGEPKVLGIAPDRADALAGRIAEAGGADVLVTIGGASVGDHDLVAEALRARGLALEFWKVALRPGKPLIFGRLGAMRVLGLPGNPVSALLCARLFLVPLVRALQGDSTGALRREVVKLVLPLEPNGPRLHLMRGRLGVDAAGALTVAPLPSQDASLLSALVAADCLIVRAPNAPAAPEGSLVEIERL